MSSDCGKFNCSRSATHRLVIAASNGDVVHKPRCEACGKADQRMLAKLNYLVPPGATVSLEAAGAQDGAVGDLTRAELLAALKVERERYEALAADVRNVARPMQLAGLRVKFSGDLLYEEEVPVIAALFKDTEPQEARP